MFIDILGFKNYFKLLMFLGEECQCQNVQNQCYSNYRCDRYSREQKHILMYPELQDNKCCWDVVDEYLKNGDLEVDTDVAGLVDDSTS